MMLLIRCKERFLISQNFCVPMSFFQGGAALHLAVACLWVFLLVCLFQALRVVFEQLQLHCQLAFCFSVAKR